MSLYGAFAKARHFAELADNDFDQHGNLLTPTARRNQAFQNLTGDGSILASEVAALQGLTATSTELNLTDGSALANNVASKLAMLDAAKALRTNANLSGTAATGVTAVEYGDGYNHVTVLTLAGIVLTTPTGSTDSSEGFLIYTLPAGACIIDSAYMNMAATVVVSGGANTDEADIGIGTVIASGNTAVLSHTATFEDILTGQALADCDGTDPIPVAALPTIGAPLFIATGDAHTIHFNLASDWVDGTTITSLGASGTIVLNWKFLE